MDIKEWLMRIGMEHHAACFAENDVGSELLSELTNEDLKDLGVAKLAERKIVLKAIANLSDAAGGVPVEALAPLAVQEGERRQVTVLFADLSGFTKLSAGLDAEETHRLLNRYFEIVDGIVPPSCHSAKGQNHEKS